MYTRQEGLRSQIHPRYFRLGGIALLGGFSGALLFDDRLVVSSSLLTLIIGATLAMLIGMRDDFWPLHWRWQLLAQGMLGILLYSTGMSLDRIHLGNGYLIDFSLWPGVSLLLTLIWVVFVMNAINWSDGVDGLMGGVSMVTLLTLFVLSFQPEVNQPTVTLLTSMLFGATIAFSLFNWFPATIFAGTSGTLFMGFVIAALSLYAGTKVATALLVLGIPLLDAMAVIVSRLLRGQSPFLPDHQHFHHLLMKFGWSSRQVALFYTLLAAVMALLALTTQLLEKMVVFFVVAVVFFGGVILTRYFLRKQSSIAHEA